MNKVLRILLQYSKQSTLESGWKPIALLLTPIYSFTPSFYQVVEIVTREYLEAIKEPRFELSNDSITNLIFAPIKGFQSLSLYGNPLTTDEYSIEQFYTATLNHMISNLRIARVDWCIEELE